jgi:hypothetical protein
MLAAGCYLSGRSAGLGPVRGWMPWAAGRPTQCRIHNTWRHLSFAHRKYFPLYNRILQFLWGNTSMGGWKRKVKNTNEHEGARAHETRSRTIHEHKTHTHTELPCTLTQNYLVTSTQAIELALDLI